jgi:hypothetical protein
VDVDDITSLYAEYLAGGVEIHPKPPSLCQALDRTPARRATP